MITRDIVTDIDARVTSSSDTNKSMMFQYAITSSFFTNSETSLTNPSIANLYKNEVKAKNRATEPWISCGISAVDELLVALAELDSEF